MMVGLQTFPQHSTVVLFFPRPVTGEKWCARRTISGAELQVHVTVHQADTSYVSKVVYGKFLCQATLKKTQPDEHHDTAQILIFHRSSSRED